MSNLKRKTLAKWLVEHEFEQLAGTKTSHTRYRHPSGVVITVADHGKQELSKKHVGMIVRQLEDAGFDRDDVRRALNAR